MPPVASELATKKGRHRHLPAQLAALNQLYDLDEHPALELRVSLAEKLGMETKTVNAWFQNKRASSKKRTANTKELSAINTRGPVTTDTTYSYTPALDDDEMDLLGGSDLSANADHTSLSENDAAIKRLRMRPSADQSEELKKFFNDNPHPSTDERQAVADRIGMQYQSVTNWFQNQRSHAKRRKADDIDIPLTADAQFPQPSRHPSLPASTSRRPQRASTRRHRSPSVSSSHGDKSYSPRRSLPRRSTTPYGVTRTPGPRRSRPEPYQLEALRDLYNQTSTPSVEDRSALAQEIGMDTRRVTNWFRNVRQSSRKRATKKTGSDGEDEEYSYSQIHSSFVSRSGSPASSLNNDDYDDLPPQSGAHSSEDDEQEAVTPSPPSSPHPGNGKLSNLSLSASAGMNIEFSHYPGFDMDQVIVAHCLIDFHSRIVE